MDTQPPTASVAAPSTKVQTYLLERHIPVLTELLVGCAHKWLDISIALGLPEWVRKDLSIKALASGCRACFGELLTRWIVDKHPTLEKLREVLKSQFIGLGREADKLCAINLEHDVDEHPPLSKRPCLETPLLEIVRKSGDTVVSDGKTTLLEVQAVTSQDSSIQYQWFKDDQPFSECHDSILCIDNASLFFKGKYKCITSTQDGSVSISSKPIFLDISFAPIKRILVHKYLSEPEVPEDSWPPEGNNTYINLALIKPGNIDKAGEYGRNTVQGNVDDILADKDSIEYDQAFTDLKSTTRLLIEGRPGSGKTTLAHKFSQDWARGNPQLNLKCIKLLFLVHLRGFFNERTIKLCDIVQLFYAQKSMVDTIVQQAEESNGEGFCFILDGLDEYRPKSMKSTFIFRLIKKEALPMAVVIIASRPAASSQFRRTASKQIEVIGFLKKQITEYVDKYPFCNAERHELHTYLEHHPNVHHMCYLPIHAAMVCYLFDVMGSILPRTETEMYKEFTNLTLLRTLKRNQGETQLDFFESIEDLPDTEKKLLTKICELSFQKTVSSKQVMKRSEVHHFFDQVSSGMESLGLITVDSIAKKYGFEDLYTFLHLTFQEYLAAYHLFQMDKECQLKELRKHGKKKHMQVVWKFFCGLAQFAENDTRLVELVKTAGIKEDSLFGVQCAFESQQSVVCDYVVESVEHGTLSLKSHFLTPSDLTAIGYVMKTSTYPVEKLELDRCKLGQEGVVAFLEEAKDKILSVKTLCYFGSDFKQLLFNSTRIEKVFFDQILGNGYKKKLEEALGFSFLFLNSLSIESQLNLNNYELPLQHIGVIANYLKQQLSHTCLNLSSCGVCDDGCAALADGLAHCSSLKELFLKGNNISDMGAVRLSDALKCCTQLRRLDLGGNKIGDNGAVRLSDALKCCSQLQSLNLGSNLIGATGITAIANSIEHCSNLQTLDISHNDIGDVGAASLAASLKHLSTITVLNLVRTSIGDAGACSLAEAFKSLVKVENLCISYCGIGNTGAKAIGSSISHCTALKKLDMCYNHIGDDGAISLSSGLHHLKNMIELNLSYNSIGDEGSEAIARAVAHMEGLKLRIWNHGISERGRSYIASHVKDIDTDFHSLNITRKTALEINILLQNMQFTSNCVTKVSFEVDDYQIFGNDSVSVIINNCPNLPIFDVILSNFSMSDQTDSVFVSGLAEVLKHCTNLKMSFSVSSSVEFFSETLIKSCENLKVLNFQCSDLSINCVKAFARIFQQVSSFQTVEFELNGLTFGAFRAYALAEGQQHWNLETLVLDDIEADVGGLAVALGHYKCLHTFKLTHSKIYEAGEKAFVLSLLDCNNLRTLKLIHCSIGDDGVDVLARYLLKCSNLQNLDLSHCDIGKYGAKALQLNKCSSLQNLSLSHAEISNDDAKALAEDLQKCGNLQSLDLSHNEIDGEGAEALLRAYSHLQNLNLSCNINAIETFRENLEYLKVYRQALDKSESIEMWFIKMILLGAPGLGKTTVRRRLMGEIEDIASSGEGVQSSTGVVESGQSVLIRKLFSTLAIVTPSEWRATKDVTDETSMVLQLFHDYFHGKHLYREEESTPDSEGMVHEVMEAAGEVEIVSASSSAAIHTSRPTSNPVSEPSDVHQSMPVLPQSTIAISNKQNYSNSEWLDRLRQAIKTNSWKDVENLFMEVIFLWFEDTGGQPEFMDMLPALTIGPALYLLFCKLTDDFQKPYTVTYRNPSGESTEPVQSTYTVEEVFLSALASIDCLTSSSSLVDRPANADYKELLDCSKKSIAYIIGTHRDKVTEDELASFNEKLQDSIEATAFFKEQLVWPLSDDGKMLFPIDNMNGGEQEVEGVRCLLEKGIKKHFSRLAIPASWLMLSLNLRSSKKRTVSVEYVLQLAEKELNMSEKDLEAALWFLHHHAGVLMYFPKLKGLADTVICDPQLVYDSTTSLIVNTFRGRQVHSSAANKFREKGQFRFTDIEKATKEISGEFLPIEKLLLLLEHLNIIVPVDSPPAGQRLSCEYFMPCVLQNASQEELDVWWEKHSKPSPATLFFVCECGYMPIGVFPALIANLVRNKGSDIKQFLKERKKNCLHFRFGQFGDIVTLISQPKFYAVHVEQRLSSNPLQSVCNKVRHLIESTLKDVTSQMNYSFLSGYQLGFECSECPEAMGNKHLCVLDKSSKSLRCLDDEDHWLDMNEHQNVWFTKASFATPSAGQTILERHIPELIEQLVGCAHKWLNISMALGLPERVRKDLRTKELDSDCTACFGELLTRWIVDRYEHAKPPTLENLKAALRSKCVQMGREAENLKLVHALDLEHDDEHPPLLKLQHF